MTFDPDLTRYVTGTSHHLLGPLAIIVSSPEIRQSAVQVDMVRLFDYFQAGKMMPVDMVRSFNNFQAGHSNFHAGQIIQQLASWQDDATDHGAG